MNRIYALVDPRDPEKIRYVGKTNRPLHVRLCEHRKSAKMYDYHVKRWVRKIMAEGVKPMIIELEIVEGNWQEAEVRWIEDMKRTGHRLCNETLGGEGRVSPIGQPLTDEARKRISEGLRKAHEEKPKGGWKRPDNVVRNKEEQHKQKVAEGRVLAK